MVIPQYIAAQSLCTSSCEDAVIDISLAIIRISAAEIRLYLIVRAAKLPKISQKA
jgi:hypothetical protein